MSDYTYYSCNDTGEELVPDLVRELDGRLQSYEGREVWIPLSEALRPRLVPLDDAGVVELKAKLDSFEEIAMMPDETDLDVDREDRFGWSDV